MEWSDWTSPIGLGLFILSLSFAFYIFTLSIHTLSKKGNTGKETGKIR